MLNLILSPRSQITKEDDNLWPMPDRVGRQVRTMIDHLFGKLSRFASSQPHCPLTPLQELEIVHGDSHISFTTAKIGSMVEVNESKYV